MILFPYQVAAVESVRSAFGEVKRVCLTVPTGCLSGDTKLTINRAGGVRVLPIKTVVHRLNGGISRCFGKDKSWDLGIETFTQSVDLDGYVKKNKIIRGWRNGIAEVFEVTTKSGRVIRATASHRFLTPDGFVELRNLRCEDSVMVAKWPKARADQLERKNKYDQVGHMWSHPYASRIQSERDGRLARVPYHRLVAEARLNGIGVNELVGRLILKSVDGLHFLDPKTHHVHHLDRNSKNNAPENLEVLDASEHLSRHGKDHCWKNLAGRVFADRVVNIALVGEEEVFDLELASPMNNYVANEFAVHNSGKTVIAADVVRRALAKGLRVVWLAHRVELVGQAAATIGDPRVHVLTVQSLYSKKDLPPADLLVIDECVSPDTIVGGKKASDVRVGDVVQSWDGSGIVNRKVSHVFKNHATTLRKLSIGATSIEVTDTHPIFVQGKGYIHASKCAIGDMCLVWEPYATDTRGSTTHSEKNMLGEVPIITNRRNTSRDGSKRFRENIKEDERAKPDAHQRDTREVGEAVKRDWPQTEGTGGKWPRPDRFGNGTSERVGVDDALHDHNGWRVSASPLQIGHKTSESEDCDRGGRRISLFVKGESGGQAERGLAHYARLDRIEIFEQGSDGTFGGRCPGGVVFNFEVEGEHNFFANGVLTHNCHAAIADAYLAIAQRYAGAFVLGLTATPERGDGKGLGGLFDRLIVGAKISELIDLKRLVPAEMHRPDRRLRSNQIAASPSAAYCVRAFGTQAISFTNLVSAAKEHNIGFLEAGIESAVIHGGMDPVERSRTLDRFRAGEIKVLNNVFVLTEGLDIPSVETIILARSCGTMGTYIQMVGRALRAYPGKERAIVLDLHGVSHTFGHPQDEVTYSLDGRGIVKSGSTADVNQYCSVCGAISDGEPICAECGIERATGKAPEVVERPLEKFAFVRSRGDRRAILLRWAKDAKETGKQPGFVYHKYKATFGDTPNWNEIVEAMR